MPLERTYDRKTTTIATPALRAKVGNTFGLTSVASCPNATPSCLKVCYATRTEKMYPSAGRLVDRNFDQLKNAALDDMICLLVEMIVDFVAECDRHGSRKIFRIHWDGDFFSDDYIRAWRHVIKYFRDIQFWTYTRNPKAAKALANIENLSLYFSADRDNIADAKKLAAMGIKIAAMADTFLECSDIQRQTSGKRGIACPEQRKTIPLIDQNGGACAQCKLCIDTKANINFATKRR